MPLTAHRPLEHRQPDLSLTVVGRHLNTQGILFRIWFISSIGLTYEIVVCDIQVLKNCVVLHCVYT